MLRAGVLGAGVMGGHHARSYAHFPSRVELAGVFDPDAARARAVAERYDARAYTDVEALLADVDVVTIASPSRLHVEHALLALEHGCDVLVEKPVALDAAGARHLQRAAAADPRGPVVAVGHIEHFNPAVSELRKLLDGRRVLGVDCRRLGPASTRNGDIDVVQDLMLHDLHVVLTLADGDAIVDVHAAGVVPPASDKLEYAVATVSFSSGAIATFGASRATEERVRRMSITAVDSHVTVDLASRTLESCRATSLAEGPAAGVRSESVVSRVLVPNDEPLLAQTRSFLDAVVARRPPEVGLDTALRCMELVEAIRAAAGRPAPLALVS